MADYTEENFEEESFLSSIEIDDFTKEEEEESIVETEEEDRSWEGKRLQCIAPSVDYYSTQRWTKPSGQLKKGQHFLRIDEVVTTEGSKQYKVRDFRNRTFYLTTNSNLVCPVE